MKWEHLKATKRLPENYRANIGNGVDWYRIIRNDDGSCHLRFRGHYLVSSFGIGRAGIRELKNFAAKHAVQRALESIA